MDVLSPVALASPSTGRKLKGFLSKIFEWSIPKGYRTDNPANGTIKAALPKSRTKAHHKAIPWADVPSAVQTIPGIGRKGSGQVGPGVPNTHGGAI